MVELYDYQKAIVRTVLERPHVLINAPMGAGKTLSVLTALSALILQREVRNVLILAPKRVASSVWQQEAEQYSIPINISYCATGLDVKLKLLEPANHCVCVCSVTRIAEIPHGCWDMVVADESSLFGNKMSQRSKEMRRICKKVKRRTLLTGTPVHGGYEKLWHQVFLLDGGKALCKSLTDFRGRFMRVKVAREGAFVEYEIDPQQIPDLKRRVSDLVYTVRDAIKLPDVLIKNVRIDLPCKRRREYNEFHESSVIRFFEETGIKADASEKSLIAFSRSAMGSKLRQLASGVVYADETNRTYSVTHKEKIEALKELRESHTRGLLVAYNFKSEYEELKKAFPTARTIESPEDVRDWNNGNIEMLLCHPASVGHGLNLQHGGHVVVWYSLTYDAELYAQLNKRLHRNGQKEIVSIVHLIAKGTIEERILSILKSKQNVADDFNNG